MAIGTPVVLASSTDSADLSTYVLPSTTPPSSGLLVLALLSTSSTSAEVPTSVVGNGVTWTLVDTTVSSNDRARSSVYVASGAPTSGSVTVQFTSVMQALAWQLFSIPGAGGAGKSGVANSSIDQPVVDLAPLAPGSATLGALAVNSTSATLTPGSGQVRLSSDLSVGSPSGVLCVTWADPGESTMSTTVSSTATRSFVAVEILEAEDTEPPPPDLGVHLVVGGVEVSATMYHVQDGIEVLVTAIEAPTPPGDPYAGMFVGARVGSGITEDFEGVEALIGAPMGVSRTYSSGFPSSPPSSLTDDYGKRASWHSMKADWQAMADGNHDAALTSFLNAIPADHDLILTFAHEPENDNPSGSSYNSNPDYVIWQAEYAPRWRAAQARFYDVVKTVRPQTWVGPILMNGTFRDSSSQARDWWEWIPPVGKMDFYGLDLYNAYHFPMTGNSEDWYDWPPNPGSTRFQQPLQRFQTICDDRGVPGAIGETATAEDETGIGVTRKVGWIQDGVQWALDHDYLAFAYFHSYKEGDTGRDMLLDSSPQSLTAWRDILIANPRGVKAAP